jgi:hypothetical protein
MGARGASASSEAADVVILTDRVDRVGEALLIGKRAREIAIQSIVAGMGLSTLAMLAATIGWLTPVPAAIVQEIIDVAVILNALRALSPAYAASRRGLSDAAEQKLQLGHVELLRSLERLRSIADALGDATEDAAAALVVEANAIFQGQIVKHERDDEGEVYPRLSKILRDNHGLSAMSRAHREILHVARLLGRTAEDLPSQKMDRYLIHEAQRLVMTVETLVRIHSAQEDDIYSAVAMQ